MPMNGGGVETPDYYLSFSKNIYPYLHFSIMRLFGTLFLCFILLYMAMVVSHECGHYAAARAVGYSRARIHFNHTDTGKNLLLDEYKVLFKKNKVAINSGQPYADSARFEQLNVELDEMGLALEHNKYNFGKGAPFIYSGGPLANILAATIGLFLLLLARANFKNANKLKPQQWAIVLTALIWFKPLYELVGVFFLQIVSGRTDMLTD
jgi:hypothetical protein